MNNLAKITKLISRGEKIVVVNDLAEPQFIIMNVDEYEKTIDVDRDIKGLTEEELLAKINRDIAVWRNIQKVGETAVGDDNFIQDTIGVENFEFFKKSKITVTNPEDEENDKYYFEPIDIDEED